MKDFLSHCYSQFMKAPISVLHDMFKELVQDSSAPADYVEQQVNERVAQAIVEVNDPESIMEYERAMAKYSRLSMTLESITEILGCL